MGININGDNLSSPDAHFDKTFSSVMLETIIIENQKVIKKSYNPKWYKKYSQSRTRKKSLYDGDTFINPKFMSVPK